MARSVVEARYVAKITRRLGHRRERMGVLRRKQVYQACWAGQTCEKVEEAIFRGRLVLLVQ